MQSYYNVNAYIPYAAHYIYNDIYFIAESLHFLISLNYFVHPLPMETTNLFSVSMSLVLFSYICSFVFLDFINKWNYIVFVFPWLIPLSVIPSRPIQVVMKGKVHLFCDWVLFHCIYLHIYVIFLIHYILDISNISCILMDF